jgi:hypothetical protein
MRYGVCESRIGFVRDPSSNEGVPMVGTALAKLLTLKVAAAATIATTAAGGVALAATGTLPTPFGGTNPSNPAPAHPTGKPANAPDKGADAQPSPSLVGLCRAFVAGATDNDGHAIDNPAFSVLISAAGGEDKVAAYCDGLLATAPGADAPPAHPTGPPSEVPMGPPSTVPSQAPADHPTGPPSR